MKKNPFWGNPFDFHKRDIENEIDFLSSVPIFDSLSKRHKKKLHTIMYTRNYDKGEIVFRHGDPGVGLYVVMEGEVDVFIEYSDMTCRKISVLKKGAFFGETSLLNESPRSATVISSCKTTLLGLFKPDLMNLMDSDPTLGLRLILRISQIVAERLRLVNEDFRRLKNEF